MKKIIFGGVIGFAVGVVAGYVIHDIKTKKEVIEEEKVDEEVFDFNDDWYEDVDDEPVPVIKEESDEVKERREQLERLKYASVAAEKESPKEEDPDERPKEKPVKEHQKDIELMKSEDWWDEDSKYDDYDFEELYYFVNEGLLMPETNGPEELDIEELTGDIFDRIGFATNDDDNIYIRNNILKKCYKVIKVTDITPDEMWP